MPKLEIPTILKALQYGEVTIKGEFVWGSNYTFLAEVCSNGEIFLGVTNPAGVNAHYGTSPPKAWHAGKPQPTW